MLYLFFSFPAQMSSQTSLLLQGISHCYVILRISFYLQNAHNYSDQNHPGKNKGVHYENFCGNFLSYTVSIHEDTCLCQAVTIKLKMVHLFKVVKITTNNLY